MHAIGTQFGRGVLASVLFLLVLSAPARLYAQESASPPQQNRSPGESIPTGEYEPYTEEEFPEWARDMRRFESIFFGSIPFTLFFTTAGWETYAYVENDFSSQYLPLFLGTSPAKQQYLASTRWQRVTAGLSLSLVIATADYLLGLGDNEGRDRTDNR